MKHIKAFEEVKYKTINKSELDDNWSTEYNIAKKKGLKPFIKVNGGEIEEVKLTKTIKDKNGEDKEIKVPKSIPKNAIYMTDADANELNNVNNKISKLQEEYDKKLDNIKKKL